MTTIIKYIDTPFTWAIIGFIIGLVLGVNFTSVVLVAIGLGAFVVYIHLHGSAKPETEGGLFAAAPAFIVAWMAGFIAHNLVL